MKNILATAALGAALVAAPASAHVYVGAGLGIAHVDSSEVSWKILGGYQHNRYWGIEAAYTDLGGYQGSDADSVSLAFTGTLPLDRRWAIMGKAGVASNRTRAPGSHGNADALVGIGVAYSVSRHFGWRLEYEHFGKVEAPGGAFNERASNLALVAKYTF